MGQPALKGEDKHYPDLLEKLDEIPTLPAVAMKVSELINDPNSSGAEIAQVLKQDQVLTARVLRLVNSSYYSIPGGVTDVQRALGFLGFNTLAQLVLSVSVFSVFSHLKDEDFSMTAFWKHALGVGVCSEILAKHVSGVKPEEAFTCGLLHDIGKLVMFQIDRPRLLAITHRTRESGSSFFDIERDSDQPGHSYLGEVMASKWGLPQSIRLAIRYHHFDVSKMDTILSSAKPLIHTVRLANLICVKNRVGHSGDCSPGEIPPELLQTLRLSETQLPDIHRNLHENLEKAGAFLHVDG